MKKQNTYRLTQDADQWLTEEAAKQGLSKNNILQILVNKAKEESTADPPRSSRTSTV